MGSSEPCLPPSQNSPSWWVLGGGVAKICKTCPGESSSHKHLPWGLIKDKQGARFATSEETAYPFPLAAEIAICFAEELKNRGWKPPAETHSSDQVASLVKCRASTGIQPKSSRLPPLVRAAHKAILVIRGPSSILSQHRLNPMERTKVPLSIDPKCTTSSNFDQFPAESQHLRSTPMRSRGGLDCAKGHDGELASGIPYSPQEFVRAAVEAGHPHHIKNLIPKVLMQCGTILTSRIMRFVQIGQRCLKSGFPDRVNCTNRNCPLRADYPLMFRKSLNRRKFFYGKKCWKAQGTLTWVSWMRSLVALNCWVKLE